MVPASANATQPAVHALFAPGIAPAGAEQHAHWDHAPSVVLGGFNGSTAQRTEVRALWNDEWLFFAFTCSDNAIVSPGGADGLDHFRLGDTAEIFIARRGAKNYFEIHATPAGRKSVYCFSDYRRPADPAAAAGNIHVFASEIPRGWRAFAAVPRNFPDVPATGVNTTFSSPVMITRSKAGHPCFPRIPRSMATNPISIAAGIMPSCS